MSKVQSPIYKSPAGEQAVMAWYDSMLARWPVPYQALTVPTRHGDTFVLACGNESAPPLLLLHGAGSNSCAWGADVVHYAPLYRVYAVDLLGEPGKSAPNRPDWKGPAYAEWLEDVLDALKLDRATLIGLSQGAWTAVKFAVRQPQRVDKLVLLTPGGITRDRLSFALRVIPLSLLGRWGMRRINRLVLGGQVVSEEVEEALTLIGTQFRARMGVLPLFSDAELGCLTMPVLLLVGDQDALRDGNKIAARMQALLPHLSATIIPGAGHALLNTPAYILPFLATHHA